MSSSRSVTALLVLILVFVAAPGYADYALIQDIVGDHDFGWSVAMVGDFDDDGVDDIAIGNPWQNRVYVHSGATALLIREYSGGEVDFNGFGSAVAGLGDVTGDGFPDLVVGAHGDNRYSSPPGRVVVVDGETDTVATYLDGNDELPIDISGSHNTSFFGWRVVNVGDLDGDGKNDFAVGEPYAAGGGGYAGQVQVFSSADGSELGAYARSGTQDPIRAGEVVANLGDLNGDGTPEIGIGIPRDGSVKKPFSGRLIIVDGASGSDLYQLGGSVYSGFGSSVCGLGDMNGDGLDDFAVGAPGALETGVVTIHSAVRKTLLATIPAPHGVYTFGTFVASAGDLDGDGVNEVLVGALPKWEMVNEVMTLITRGAFTIWKISGKDAYEVFRYVDRQEDYIGDLATMVPDANGDGLPDLLISMWGEGKVRIVPTAFEMPPLPVSFPTHKSQGYMTRPEDDEESRATGKLQLKTKKSKFSLKLALKKLSPDAGPSVWLEDGPGLGTFTQIGSFEVSKSGKGIFTLAGDGEIPPALGIDATEDLVGRILQIRAGPAGALLSMVIPPLVAAPDIKEKGSLTAPEGSPFEGASASFKLSFAGKKATSKIDLKVKKVDKEAKLSLWVEDGDGQMVMVASLEKGKLKIDTKKGQPLPFGATSIADLSGRKVEIRIGPDLVMSGVLP